MNGADQARVFVGLHLGEAVAGPLLAAVEASLGPDARRGYRFPRADGLHLTLVFLGRVERGLLGAMGAELARALAGHAAPELRLTAPGSFPKPGRERVLWVGIEERGGGRLAVLRAAVLAALGRAGWETALAEGDPFHPHVTVARPRPGTRVPEAFYALTPAELGDSPWCAVEVTLFESVAGPGPRRYEPLARVALTPV